MLTFWQRPFKFFWLSRESVFWSIDFPEHRLFVHSTNYSANELVVQHFDWLNIQKAGATGS